MPAIPGRRGFPIRWRRCRTSSPPPDPGKVAATCRGRRWSLPRVPQPWQWSATSWLPAGPQYGPARRPCEPAATPGHRHGRGGPAGESGPSAATCLPAWRAAAAPRNRGRHPCPLRHRAPPARGRPPRPHPEPWPAHRRQGPLHADPRSSIRNLCAAPASGSFLRPEPALPPGWRCTGPTGRPGHGAVHDWRPSPPGNPPRAAARPWPGQAAPGRRPPGKGRPATARSGWKGQGASDVRDLRGAWSHCRST